MSFNVSIIYLTLDMLHERRTITLNNKKRDKDSIEEKIVEFITR
jgi:hypothetical protein